MTEYHHELEVAGQAAREAAAIILRHYAAGRIAVETKDDDSPVTQADKDANTAIIGLIRAAFPADAILSEELPDDIRRLRARRVWIVDPLDGTRDFVARTGDFCVHVALAVDGEATVGAVFQPVAGLLYTAATGAGAFRALPDGTVERLRVSATGALGDLRVGVSRLNVSDRLGACLRAAHLDGRAVIMGASVKHMAIARGALDAVINLSPGECEWDTCAPEVIVREAGGAVTDGQGRPFRYNQPDVAHRRGSIASNGRCHQELVALVAPFLDVNLDPNVNGG